MYRGFVSSIRAARQPHELWQAPTAARPFLAAHLKSLADSPPSQGADTLRMRKAVEEAMKKLENPVGSSN